MTIEEKAKAVLQATVDLEHAFIMLAHLPDCPIGPLLERAKAVGSG